MVFAIGFTFVFVWAIIFPLAIAIILKNNIRNLNEKTFLADYGLFYVGLRD